MAAVEMRKPSWINYWGWGSGDMLGAGAQAVITGWLFYFFTTFCDLTPVEAGELHLADLKSSAMDYDPAVRDRLLAGALLPHGVAQGAQRYRTIFRDEVRRAFQSFDILLAPASVCPAPGIGQTTMEMGGQQVSVRKNLGAFTQPISYIGLPVLAAPVNRPGQLPIGVQIIAPAWREDLALAAGLKLQRLGVVAAHAPEGLQ